jgi:phosphoribosylanthranilate isomerase
VTTAEVAAIVPHLPEHVQKIGVFSTPDADEIIGIVRLTGLTGVQLHGSFDLPLVRKLDAAFDGKITIIQVLHWTLGDDQKSAIEIAAKLQEISAEPVIRRVLIDTKTSGASGGTGLSFDWTAARAALDSQPQIHIIAAGGLHPRNVAKAIQKLKPWGVDVASGVEASRGRKDAQKLKEFIEAARKT